MDKRYQVFISSTYTDLRDERASIIQALMEMDCIPAGMELFPAADEEQWQFIKRVISDCDYYLLVIGGRYGSVTSEGISYTEKEYDYAVEMGLKVVALVHGSPENLSLAKSETLPERSERLAAFRGKVTTGRLVKFWQSSTELPGLVALSLGKTIKAYPAVGWVRANAVANVDILTENNELRRKIERLESRVRDLEASSQPLVVNIADLDDSFVVSGTAYSASNGSVPWKGKLSWRTIFGLLGPHLMQPAYDSFVSTSLAEECYQALGGDASYVQSLDGHVFHTIKIQLLAYQLVEYEGGAWSLTERGRGLMLETRTIKKSSTSDSK